MPLSEMIRVVVVEDHQGIRRDLEAMIDHEKGMVCIGAFPSAESFLESEVDEIDVVLMDIGLPAMSGIEAIGPAKRRWPRADILMLTVHHDEEQVFSAICSGAIGYLLKSTPPEQLLDAVRDIRAGGAPMSPSIARKVVARMHSVPSGMEELSEREQEVLDRLIAGKTNAQIAAELFVSVNTISFHVKQIYRKLHVHSRAAAVAKAVGRR